MLKHLILIILLTILIVFTSPYLGTILQQVVADYGWISKSLGSVLKGSEAGDILRQVLALLALPFSVALIPAAIYSLLRRKWLPCFMQIVWTLWLVQTTAVITVLHMAGKSI